jgi:hypothetical protein
MISRKFKVKISTLYDDWPFDQQTPGNSLCWGNYKFYINDDSVKEFDYWVVYEGLKKNEAAKIPSSNLLLITAEPPNFKRYARKYLNQFPTVRSSHEYIKHKNLISSHPALPWHIGRIVRGGTNLDFVKSYDKLISLKPQKKTRLISVITSDKAFTKEHIARLEFVKKIKKKFKNKLEIFGRGIREIDDKWDAIAPYKYHLVIENGCFYNYWTEKISDAFLANAFPFYIGCPNLKDFFPEDSFISLNINDENESYKKIKFAIENNFYERSISSRALARELCLKKYNLFPEIVEWCKSKPIGKTTLIKIEPEQNFIEIPKAAFSLKGWISRYYRKIIKRK